MMKTLLLMLFAFSLLTILVYLFFAINRKLNDKLRQQPLNLPVATEYGLDVVPVSNFADRRENRITQNTKTSPRIGETYRINYQDRNGEITRRSITIHNLYRKNSINYIKAYCYLRCEERTFRLDGITGFMVDIKTGEMLDPNVLNPLKSSVVVAANTAKTAAHMAISSHYEGWFLHDPNEKVNTKPERQKLGLIVYQSKRDAYQTAINKTIEGGMDTLCLYMNGLYKPSKEPDNAGKITIIRIDMSTRAGFSQMKALTNATAINNTLTSSSVINDEDSLVQRPMPWPDGSESRLTSRHLSKSLVAGDTQRQRTQRFKYINYFWNRQ